MQGEVPGFDRSLPEVLRRIVKGSVLVPGDADYDAARAVYFSATDRRPAAIVRAADEADVARVVATAREAGAGLAVRNGGHSPAAHGVIDGGVVLDVRGLATLAIDVAGRTARAGAGLTAGAYTAATGAHGLATGFGDAPTVGIGGITLAGGIGFLHRRHGMTIDNVLAADIVTADGELRRVSADSHPDLFWAIRGGGGNVGVVTSFEYRLQEVGTVLAGMLLLPVTAASLVALLEAAAAAPDELSMIIAVMQAPPMPMIPPEHHGCLVAMLQLVYTGERAAGERALAPFRALGPPIADLVRAVPYPEIYGAEAAPHPAAVAIHTRFIDTLDGAAAEAALDRLRSGTAPMRVLQFRPLGGAVARVPAEATAFAHRARRFVLNVAAMYEDPAQGPEHAAWAAGLAAELGTAPPGAYVAFLGADGPARIHEAYPAPTRQRLAAIKQRYDPTNVFRHNHNVAAGG